MHSLLATLAELRIILLTLFVSGAVHLAIIDAGWLEDAQAPALAGQNLAITVTATKPQALPSTDFPPLEPKSETEAATVDSMQKTEAPIVQPRRAQHESDRAVATKSQPVAAQRPSTQQVAEAKKAEPEVEDNATLQQIKQQKPPEPEIADQQDVAPSLPQQVYQQQPAFMTPPKPPRYPRMARKRGIEGLVMLRVELDKAGEITALSIEQSSGSGLLDKAATQAVERWQFAPAQRNGIAVASYVRIPVNFVLE